MAKYIDIDACGRYLFDKIGFSTVSLETVLDHMADYSDHNSADVAPRAERGAECPICHGTGQIGTTDWLTRHLSKKQLAEEKAKAIAEHEGHIKAEVAREIIADLENSIDRLLKVYIEERAKEYAIDTPLAEYLSGKIDACSSVKFRLAELEKKYTEEGK